MLKQIESALDLLKDESRFYIVSGEKYSWCYDAINHTMYSVDKDIFNKLKVASKNEILDEVNKIDMLKLTPVLNFFSSILVARENEKIFDYKPKKCTVMINTSNKCNLNCSYCYRDKKKHVSADISKIKEALDFVTKEYMPNADEFVVSYGMTSESSLDLPLLKQVADEYVNYESYFFTEDDILEERREEFFSKLKEQLFHKLPKILLPKDSSELLRFLNELIKMKDLPDVMELSKGMFNEATWHDVSRRKYFTDWKLYRVNRWCIQLKYGGFVKDAKRPYVGFWFMSNGTNVSEEYIRFIKACDINPFWLSIDGPKDVHDFNRKYSNGNGSYDDVVKNIPIFKANGINLKASAVLTDYYPEPLKIVQHLLSLGFSEVAMTPIRPGSECSFTKESVKNLLDGYAALFEKLKEDALSGDMTLFGALKEDMCLSAFNLITSRQKLVKRCPLDEQIVINLDGSITNCLYFPSEGDLKIGSIKNGVDENKIFKNITVNKREPCNSCWARYLCGGTCFYGSLVQNGTMNKIDEVECTIRKFVAKKCVELLAFICEHNISIEKIINA